LRLAGSTVPCIYARDMHYDPMLVAKEPMWRPSAWLTRQDLVTLSEALLI